MPTKMLGKGMGGIGAILFLLGIGSAVVAAFIGDLPFTAILLAVTGLVVGFLNVAAKESLSYLVAVIAISLTSGTLSALPAIGGFVDAILINIAAFAGAAALVVALGTIFRTASK